MTKQSITALFFFVILSINTGCSNSKALTQNDETHVNAAIELLVLMNMNDLISKSVDTMLDIQIQQNPSLVNYKGTIQEFLKKYMNWDYLKNEFVKLYKEEFTENELRDMITFYKTETGKKTLLQMPTLMQKGAQIGQKSVQDNIHELEKMIAKKKAELEKEIDTQGLNK